MPADIAPAAPLPYLFVIFASYLFTFLYSLGIVLAEVTGQHTTAAALADAACFAPVAAATYAVELVAASVFGWVSWYGRPPSQVIRHHGGFALVMFCGIAPWLLDRPRTAQWILDYRAFRIWLVSAGVTNANECFIVFQNFMHLAGADPLTKPRVFRQRCLALSVMVQALVFGLPAGLFLLFRLALPLLWQGDGERVGVLIFTFGLCLQMGAQLGIQLVDSIKVWNKLVE